MADMPSITIDDTYRDAVCAWLLANDINPSDVPADVRPTISDGRITLTMYRNNSAGRRQMDPNHEFRLATYTVTVPLKQEPAGDVQLWVAPRCDTCGR